jgi:hypothetical protein
MHPCIDPGQARGAVLIGIIADRDQILKAGLSKICIYIFGCLIRNIDPRLIHHFDRKRIDSLWLQPGAVGLEDFTRILAQKGLCHLAARRVARAQK